MTSQEIRKSLPGMTKVPLIDRKEDVYIIILTYLNQFSPTEGNLNDIRPAVSFSPHIFGAGKSFVGVHFLEFLNKFAEEEEQKETEGRPGHFPESNTSSLGGVKAKNFFWKHFAENTLSVILELRESFSHAPFPRFRKALMTKQYLFLMIDELSHLSDLTKYYSELTMKQFIEPDAEYVPFRNFFRFLRDLLMTGKVIVYLAGRTSQISARMSDARSSSITLDMLRLNPFNLNDINEYLELATYNGKTLKDWRYSVDCKEYFSSPSREEKAANLSQPAINDDNMESVLDDIFHSVVRKTTTFIVPEILDSATLLRYQFVLFNYQLGTVFPINFAITLCGTTTYLMDLVATFGFYSEVLGEEFKIGCCEFILRAHSNYKFFREATELFPLSPFSYIPDTSTAKGVFFEFVFMKIFRFRLLTFLHSNSSQIVHSAIPGIFQGSFIEQDNVSYSIESTKSNDIPILRNVSHSFSVHYRKYLQHCGIFVPKEGNSSGPDAYVVFHNGQTRYVVGFSFKFYHKTKLSKKNIKKEAEKFFKGVVSVLNDESFSSVQLRFQFVVVCTRYDQSVGFSTEEHNIVEDASRLVTQHSSGSTLNESSRSCLQLVIVSQRNLEIYLGRDNVETLRKIGKANRGEFSKNFSVWCKTVFESMSNEYLSPLETEQSNVTSRVTRNIRPRTNEENRMQMEELQTAMQVEGGDARGEQSVAASSSLSSPFDWNVFLHRVGFDNNRVREYVSKLPRLPASALKYITFEDLMHAEIREEDIVKILFGLQRVSTEQR
ncbi:archaeal ATPase [Galdieria sulphuraria]|uniref:Archaeal ATPase n=1 Tax=Galdieria sulphuraria TaxID=130081 RepID=M2XYQ4_GALSU|nr:archaeal ATPase [Galdieria sulphuraria]EME28788.1 archaeal ATPase [Galdieria sulphuraria]|eukprot:XP_005705308.1 archaeal ATPase [Galdieria sulphuraria]